MPDRSFGEQYTIVRELGGGGMSRVFLATDTHLGREIVLKYLSPEICAGLSEERFRTETRVIAKLQHPYIVPLLTAGVENNCPFYTMPYVAGESLADRIERDHALPVPLVMSVMRDVAEALCYAHERGVVHRDIKPANILLTGDHAVVTDFGVAKALSEATQPGAGLTTIGSIVGTPAYMAPEQASADPFVDHRADIYGLGAVAYEM
ncbi:MAG: serine/threonine-protein kinase, partial [Patescibacteria group bacterium]